MLQASPSLGWARLFCWDALVREESEPIPSGGEALIDGVDHLTEVRGEQDGRVF
jgi:hypothetical protein